MITLESCPNCNSHRIAEFRTLLGGDLIAEITPGVKIDAAIFIRYCVCRDCSLIFQNPRLSDAELDLYYGTGYYRRTITPPPEGMEKGELNRAKVDAEIIKKFMGNVNSHLDIGCGRGYMLRMMDAKIKVGTESDPGYVKVKGTKIYSGIDKIPKQKFDLITILHVLEHLPYPLDYLKRMAKLVNRNGYVVIEVPSWKTRGGPLGFAHLFHFESDVLRLMCLRVGLTPIATEFTPHLVLVCRKQL